MRKGPPICKKCGTPHWPFNPCPRRPEVSRSVPWSRKRRFQEGEDTIKRDIRGLR